MAGKPPMKSLKNTIQNKKDGGLTRPTGIFTTKTPTMITTVKPFDWIRGKQVGGRSLIWGRQTYRWSDLDFEANSKDGYGVDWPIRYKDIAPWYSRRKIYWGGW